MNKVRDAAIASLLLIAGCQSPPYVAPEGDTATLVIDNPNDNVLVAAWTYAVAADCRDPQRLTPDGPVARNSASAPIRVAAGRELSITLQAVALRGDTSRYFEECAVTGSFVPARGASYRAGYIWGAQKCSVRLLDLRTAFSVPLVQKRTIKPLSALAAHCGPMGR
jgi:hypothetical protein